MNILAIQQKEASPTTLPLLGLAIVILLGMLLFPQRTWAQEWELELIINKAGILALNGNGQIPGTLIHLNKGDSVVLRVRNNTASKHDIRWHGTYLINDQLNDQREVGTSEAAKRFYSIQKAIGAGKTFTYRWKTEKPGTFWYHCHINGNEYVRVQEIKGAIMTISNKSTESERAIAQGGA